MVDWVGNIAVGTLNANGSGNFTVNGNYCWLPFTSLPAGFNLNNNGLAITNATLQPSGLKNILYSAATQTGPYTRCRVLATKLKVTVSPIITGDQMSLAIGVMLNGGGFGSLLTAADSPLSAGPITCTGNNNIKQNQLSIYRHTAQVFGLNRKHVYEDDSYSFAPGTAPTNRWDYQVWLNTNDNTTNANVVGLLMRMYFYVELYATAPVTNLDV